MDLDDAKRLLHSIGESLVSEKNATTVLLSGVFCHDVAILLKQLYDFNIDVTDEMRRHILTHTDQVQGISERISALPNNDGGEQIQEEVNRLLYYIPPPPALAEIINNLPDWMQANAHPFLDAQQVPAADAPVDDSQMHCDR